MRDVLLSIEGLSKEFPGVRALDGVDFELLAGEVHAIFGENGAGKSTLISIIAGAQPQGGGVIRMHGEIRRFSTVADARRQGISAVFQEFSLAPHLTVEENLCLGEEHIHQRFGLLRLSEMSRHASALLERLNFKIDPHRVVATLSRAEQQMVEIAKALRGKLSVLILDEPTASLTDRESEQLFSTVRGLTQQGVGVIYITHRIQEIKRLADRVTVLRDGKHIGVVDAASTSEAKLIEMMAGRAVEKIYPSIAANPGRAILELSDIRGGSGVVVDHFVAREGEVVGVAGLVGCGKSDLLRMAFGIEPIKSGTVRLDGQIVDRPTPRRMLNAGVFYLPSDRREEGLMLSASTADNITLNALTQQPIHFRSGFLSLSAERTVTRDIGRRVDIHPSNLPRATALLSGGNQQKVLFGRGLTRPIKLYILDEPTVGVDVGTRSAIYYLIKELCEKGAAVILISSDLPEILHMSHRAYVMRSGRLAAEIDRAQLTEAAVLKHFF
ncbi:sugar ABC transporter ATP-binding protein [Propionivibrio sp.]|jgi:ribose transport system ATP-binding protein|uniref:sugar ABC transporter ATP-binding protein n=1 Tax=Propionivibrio sp. TaxID=2212460 RepID=UPI003BF42820